MFPTPHEYLLPTFGYQLLTVRLPVVTGLVLMWLPVLLVCRRPLANVVRHRRLHTPLFYLLVFPLASQRQWRHGK